jgi:hypothetical protein
MAMREGHSIQPTATARDGDLPGIQRAGEGANRHQSFHSKRAQKRKQASRVFVGG